MTMTIQNILTKSKVPYLKPFHFHNPFQADRVISPEYSPILRFTAFLHAELSAHSADYKFIGI